MAQFVLSYPLSLDFNRFNTVRLDSDTYKAQQIKGFLRTEKNERPLLSDFGMNEPTFHTFDSGEFFDAFLNFYSSETLEISEVKVLETSGVVSDVQISFK